jgi:hypothetical protein
MLILSPNQTATFEFIFRENGNFYDPTSGSTPSDVVISVYRGDLGGGAVVDGPFSYLFQDATPSGSYIEKTSNNTFYYGVYGDNPGDNVSSYDVVKFSLNYVVPENLFPGNYSVVATTYYNAEVLQYIAQFQIQQGSTNIEAVYPTGQKQLTQSFVPKFETLEQYKTNSVLLIGHADGLEINNITRIRSIQEAIDLLKADFNSPLLRGVFDAYAAGARDIYICASAPMKEYVEPVSQRNSSIPMYGYNDATPMLMTFYQRYYDRLEESYSIIKNYDYIDIIVPLETSIINTGSVDFITQLALHCQEFHNHSGYIQIGVIGSRNNGILAEDIATFENNTIFTNKYTMFNPQNEIIGDMGRFVIPIYGELIMNHNFLNISYVSSGSATMAGLISATPVNKSLIRKKAFSVFGLSGISLNQSQVDRLDAVGVNTFIRNNRSRRGNPYQIEVTNDHTLANQNSNYRKVSLIRLASMLINEIQSLTSNTVSKFSSQKAISDVRQMLEFLKQNQIVVDYSFEAYSDSQEKGKLYFDISVVSTLGLKKLSFSILAGQGA